MFVRCFYPTFTSDSEWEQILGYGFDFPNGSNGMPGRVGKSRGRSLHGLMQSSQMMLRKWDIHPNFSEFLVFSTTRPRFSIIFHHFPSFSPGNIQMHWKCEGKLRRWVALLCWPWMRPSFTKWCSAPPAVAGRVLDIRWRGTCMR